LFDASLVNGACEGKCHGNHHRLCLQEKTGTLALVGELPNAARPEPLGKAGEQLYGSRFIGSRGYLVTYRLTDPLCILDLSNPADPKVAGTPQVNGYSDYLFPLSDNLLLGVGKDAIADGSPGNRVRVSLPITLHDTAAPGSSGAINDYFQFTRTELQKFEINLGAQSLNARAALAPSLAGERDISHDRSLLWNDQVHYFQNGIWRSAGW
jgi:hypothetical protein